MTIVGKRQVLLRASQYYERIISAKDATGLNIETAKLALGSVKESLSKFPESAFPEVEAGPLAGNGGETKPVARGKVEVLEKVRDLTPADGAVELIKLIDVNNDANTGRWSGRTIAWSGSTPTPEASPMRSSPLRRRRMTTKSR